MKSTFCLVYQGGIANVFEEIPRNALWSEQESGHSVVSDRVRVLQSDFRTCESFCRGLRKAEQLVRVAWCNEAGDITNSFWHFLNYEKAPFAHLFAKDFVPNKDLNKKSMKTYIIQFYDDGFWHNLKDDLNFPVEFVTLQSAQKIKKLIASTGKFPEISKFRIKDSKGVLCD